MPVHSTSREHFLRQENTFYTHTYTRMQVLGRKIEHGFAHIIFVLRLVWEHAPVLVHHVYMCVSVCVCVCVLRYTQHT